MRNRALARSALLLAGLFAAVAPRMAAQEVHTANRIVLNGDAVIAPNEVVDGRVVVMRGNLNVQGRVTGSVTVGAGNLVVAPGAVVEGRASVRGGSLANHGTIGGDAEVKGGKLLNDGRIAGDMREEGGAAGGAKGPRGSAEAAARIRGGWLGSFSEGVQGILSTLSLAVLLAGLGAGAVYYGYPRLQATSDALRSDALRSAGVGLAAAVLTIPALLALVFLLTITLVGIPFIPVAVPLFLVGVSAALGFGLVSAAHAIGERVAEQRGAEILGGRNGYSYTLTGLGLLLLPILAANLLRMTGVLGGLGGMLEALGWLVVWSAAVIGAGSVLLTRAGTQPAHAYDPIFDTDPVFEG